MSSLKQPLCRRAARAALLAAFTLAAASAHAAAQKVSNSGAFLPDTAAIGTGPNDWACTYDTDTQLLWEIKTNDSGLRDYRIRYTNYDDPTQPQVWNGDIPDTYHNPTAAEIAAGTNSIGFRDAVNAQGLCGFKDWRLPTNLELVSLFDPNSVADPNSVIDPNNYWVWKDFNYVVYLASPMLMWSSLPSAGDPRYAKAVAWGADAAGNFEDSRSMGDLVKLVHAGPLFELLIQTAGTGAGAVTDPAAAVNCTRDAAGATSGTCTTTGPRTLTATPAAGSQVAWSGCDSNPTPNTCVVTGTAAKTVTATFNLATYAITATASPAAGGSVACVPVSVNYGGSSTCTATASAGYTFSGFSGACTGSTCALTNITADQAVVATFKPVAAPAGQVAAVPTLSEWGLMLMGLLAAGLGARRLRRS